MKSKDTECVCVCKSGCVCVFRCVYVCVCMFIASACVRVCVCGALCIAIVLTGLKQGVTVTRYGVHSDHYGIPFFQVRRDFLI